MVTGFSFTNVRFSLINFISMQFHGIPNWRFWPIISLCTKKNTLTAEEEIEKVKEAKVGALLQREYRKLGPISFHEFGVGSVFVFTVFLWLFR